MKICKLKKEDRNYFLNMDPLMMLRRADFPNRFVLGAFRMDESTGTDIPAGLLIGCMEEERLIVEWLCVAAEQRLNGVGEELLKFVFSMAEQFEFVTVSAYFNQIYGRKLICGDEEEYFRNHLFLEEEILPGEYQTNLLILSNLLQSKEELGPSSFTAVSMEEVLSQDRKAFITTILQDVDAIKLYPTDGKKELFDRKVSFFLTDGNGGVQGGIFVQNVEDVLYPVVVLAKSKGDAYALLKAACTAAAKKYSPYTELHIMQTAGAFAEILADLMPAGGMECKFLHVKMSDYKWRKGQILDNSVLLEQEKFLEGIELVTEDATASSEESQQTVVVKVSDLLKLPFAKGKVPAGVYGIEAMDLEQIRRSILQGQYHGRQATLEDLKKLSVDTLELSVSSYVIKQNVVKGLFLLHKTEEGRLVADMLFATPPDANSSLASLLSRSVQKAIEAYSPDTEIELPIYTKASQKLV